MGNPYAPSELAQMVAEIDINRDGKITFQELKIWWKKGRQGAKRFEGMIL